MFFFNDMTRFMGLYHVLKLAFKIVQKTILVRISKSSKQSSTPVAYYSTEAEACFDKIKFVGLPVLLTDEAITNS